MDVEVLRQELADVGCAVFVLPGDSISDRASFFSAVKATLPLDPPVIGFDKWDALADSLWEGLHCRPEKRIAILWPGAGAMARDAPSDFAIALDVLSSVAKELSDHRATPGQPKEVSVIVE